MIITDEVRANIEKMVENRFGDFARRVEMEMTDEFADEITPDDSLYVRVYFDKGMTREEMRAMNFSDKFGALRSEIIDATWRDVYPGYTLVRVMEVEDTDHVR